MAPKVDYPEVGATRTRLGAPVARSCSRAPRTGS